MEKNTLKSIALKIFSFYLVIYIVVIVVLNGAYYHSEGSTIYDIFKGSFNIAIVYWLICIVFTILCLGFLRSMAVMREFFRWRFDCRRDPVLATKSAGLDFFEARKRGLVRRVPWFTKDENEESIF